MLLGASAAPATKPLPSRSARCWKIRIALGWMPVRGAVGGIVSRAKPRLSHSVVTPTQTPAVFRYSTRSQPSTRLQGAGHPPVGGTQFPSTAGSAIAKVEDPVPVTATEKPAAGGHNPPPRFCKSTSWPSAIGPRSGCRSACVLARRTRMLARLYTRDDPTGEVASSPTRGLRIIAICWAAPFAPWTKGRVRGCTAIEVPLPIYPANVVAEAAAVEVLVQVATLVCTPAGGMPPLQLARGTVNFWHHALPIAVATEPSQPPALFSTYTSPVYFAAPGKLLARRSRIV